MSWKVTFYLSGCKGSASEAYYHVVPGATRAQVIQDARTLGSLRANLMGLPGQLDGIRISERDAAVNKTGISELVPPSVANNTLGGPVAANGNIVQKLPANDPDAYADQVQTAFLMQLKTSGGLTSRRWLAFIPDAVTTAGRPAGGLNARFSNNVGNWDGDFGLFRTELQSGKWALRVRAKAIGTPPVTIIKHQVKSIVPGGGVADSTTGLAVLSDVPPANDIPDGSKVQLTGFRYRGRVVRGGAGGGPINGMYRMKRAVPDAGAGDITYNLDVACVDALINTDVCKFGTISLVSFTTDVITDAVIIDQSSHKRGSTVYRPFRAKSRCSR